MPKEMELAERTWLAVFSMFSNSSLSPLLDSSSQWLTSFLPGAKAPGYASTSNSTLY